MSQQQVILYMSNYCGHCKTLIQDLRQTPLVNQVKIISVDTIPKNSLPTFLKHVPTLVIDPSRYLTGDEVFLWFERQMHALRQQKANEQMRVNAMVSQQQSQNAREPAEPIAWNVNEMGSSFSDQYSLLTTDCSTQGNGGNDFQHNFAFLNADAGITNQLNGTQQNGGGGGQQATQQSKKAAEISQRMERLMAQRDIDMPGARATQQRVTNSMESFQPPQLQPPMQSSYGQTQGSVQRMEYNPNMF